MFAVIGFCHRLTATSRLPDLAKSLVHVYNGESHRHRKLQLKLSLHRSTIKLDEKKSSWRLKTHWDPCDRCVTPCIEISSVFPKYLRQRRLCSTVIGCRQRQVLSDLSVSDIAALWKQKSALWREGGVEPERFSFVWGFFTGKRTRKPGKKCLARCGRPGWP